MSTMIEVQHPTGHANYSEVTVGGLWVAFSYKTPIVFHTVESGLVARVNDWSNTTGRHFGQAAKCWGYEAKDLQRVSGDVFEAALEAITNEMVTV